ncbi:MAG: coproporphyrinogen-III oxidase family protein, partial [Erysipelotrichaceae bacterium]
YGVDRISLGVQSFKPSLQQLIHRSQNMDIKAMIAQIHAAGLDRISIDLMYGLPTQSLADWEADLELATALEIDHISLYALTIEEHSAFGRQHLGKVEEDLEADCYDLAIAVLSKAGFEHYEISSFARNKSYSKHNLAYWNYDDFDAIGPGASGKIGNTRFTNLPRLDLYAKGERQQEVTTLSLSEQSFEALMMQLRTCFGIDLQRFQQRFHVDLLQTKADVIAHGVKQGWLILENGNLKTTTRGMHMLHDVLIEFLD